MNIPIVIEVVTSLVFFYLVFSLLASEIQEFIATLLQWRAKHLRESIEVFLAGGNAASTQGNDEIKNAKELANRIYNHPFISTLNYEGRGFLKEVRVPQQSSREGKFGFKKTAPSYIPGDTFANSLLTSLKVPEILEALNGNTSPNPQLIQKIAEQIRYKYAKEIEVILDEISYANLNKHIQLEFERANFVKPIELLNNDNLDRKTFTEAVKKTIAKLDEYINLGIQAIPDENYQKEKIIDRIQLLKESIYEDIENALWFNIYQVDIADIIRTYRHLKDEATEIWQDPNHPIYRRIKKFIGEDNFLDSIPDGLLSSLKTLTTRTRSKIGNIETGLNEFKADLTTWFDRGMERASGVYGRNAKGFAFFVGLALAIGTNFDTFHVTSELFQDVTLRDYLGGQGVQLVTNDPQVEDLVRTEFNVEEINAIFPLGWDENNLTAQQQQRSKWQFREVNFGWGMQFIGWLMSGIAIAMGAPFWFDILNRFVRFRNTGNKPKSN